MKLVVKCIFSRLGMHARFECLYGCVGIYHGSYYFGSVRDYLLSGIEGVFRRFKVTRRHRPYAKMADMLIFFCLHSNDPY